MVTLESPTRTPSPTLTASSPTLPSTSPYSTLGSKRSSSFADVVSLKNTGHPPRIPKSLSAIALSSLPLSSSTLNLDLPLPAHTKTHQRNHNILFAPMSPPLSPPNSMDNSTSPVDITRLNSSSSFYRRQSMIIIDEVEAKKAKNLDTKANKIQDFRRSRSFEVLTSSSDSQLANPTYIFDSSEEIDRSSTTDIPEAFKNSSTKTFSASSSILEIDNVENLPLKPPIVKFFSGDGDYEEDDDDEVPSPPRHSIPATQYNIMFQDTENFHRRTLRRQSTSFASKVRFAMQVEEYSVQEWRDRWITFRYLRALERSKVSPPESLPPTLRRSVSLRDTPVSKSPADEEVLPRRESWAGRKGSKHRNRSVGLWTRARWVLPLKKAKKKDIEIDRRSLDSMTSLDLTEDDQVLITWPRASPGVPQIKSPKVEEWVRNEWERLEEGWKDWCWYYPRLEGGIKWWNAWLLFGRL